MPLYQDSISHIRSFRVIELTRFSLKFFFFKNGISKNVRKIEKNYMDSKKINKFVLNKERISYLIIY